MADGRRAARGLHVALVTAAFALCFAAWGLVGAFAPRARQLFGLGATQAGLLIAAPVVLGALARIPAGILADRFGPRLVFAVLMALAAVPAFLLPSATSYGSLLLLAFFLGLAGSSFAVGARYVSSWSERSRQGTALGFFGLGNIGQSAAVFLGPVLALAIGWEGVFRIAAVLLAVAAAAWVILARDAPNGAPRTTLGSALRSLRDPRAAALSAFYFVTFGGFVAFSIYFPTLLQEQFGLAPADAGLRTAGFVVLATGARAVGGWLSDRIGGGRVLYGVLLGIVPFALLLSWPAMLPLTVGALGCAALLGIGNGAVFKLVPQHFFAQTGTVTGLVGAIGAIGAFFPPILLGVSRDLVGTTWPAFALLAATSFALWRVDARLFLPLEEEVVRSLAPRQRRASEQIRAGAWATLASGLLAAAVLVGSRNLTRFDPALVVYTFGVLFATWGVAYHYWVWLQKPPTKLYWRRTWEHLFRIGRPWRAGWVLARSAASLLVAQSFIHRRSALRWWAHQLLFWGCVVAGLVTFPLVFGWLTFETAGQDHSRYAVQLFGFAVASFPLGTIRAWLAFHVLDLAAFLVLGGVALALWRRMRERGALAVQSFSRDFFPLVILFAISTSGLALTASTLWLRAALYDFLALAHAAVVVIGLLYLPFGKFFHIFQRPAQAGVKLYREVGDRGPAAGCASCGERFASRLHVDDLERVLGELGFDYSGPAPLGAWQRLCPACKRRAIARCQLRAMKGPSGGAPAR